MRFKFLLLAWLAGLPTISFASDFSPILLFFHGLTFLVGLVICIAAFRGSKGIENDYKRIGIKCAAISICFTPVSISGGNGNFTGFVLEALLVGLLGGDKKYFIYGTGYVVVSFTVIYVISILMKKSGERQSKKNA
jgi:hypothetical protein